MIATVRATVFGDSSASTAQHSPAHAAGDPSGDPSGQCTSASGRCCLTPTPCLDLIRRSHRQNAAACWKPLVASSAILAAATALMCASLDSAGRAGE